MHSISGKSPSFSTNYDPMEGPSNGLKDITSPSDSDVLQESFSTSMKDLQPLCSTPSSEYYDLNFVLVLFLVGLIINSISCVLLFQK